MAQARRSRINGILLQRQNHVELVGEEVITLCRKYIAPTQTLEKAFHIGPISREEIDPKNPWINELLQRSDTAFLASLSPNNRPDVAHRGGQPGFLKFDPSSFILSWSEYLGDGIFKSAGNIRSTGIFTLLVPDFETGYGIEFIGKGEYTNIRTSRQQRLSPLVQENEPFPVQGKMVCSVEKIVRLRNLTHPRKRLEKSRKFTSLSSVYEQEPQ